MTSQSPGADTSTDAAALNEGPTHALSYRVGVGCGLGAAAVIADQMGAPRVASRIREYERATTKLDEYFGVAKPTAPTLPSDTAPATPAEQARAAADKSVSMGQENPQ